MQRAVLIPHPSTVAAPVRGVAVRVAVRADGAIALSFGIEGEIEQLRIPARTQPRRVDGLWRHACVEAFVMAGSGPGYCELNFSPSGEWAAYAFRGYRDGRALEVPIEPVIVVGHGCDRLQIDVVVPAACMARAGSGVKRRLGLAAVLEDVAGRLSYWAIRHPAKHPDFHHPDSFAWDVTGSWGRARHEPIVSRLPSRARRMGRAKRCPSTDER